MKTQVTIVPADKLIMVDGEGLRFAFLAPANLHALQWREGCGHKECTDQGNQPLSGADMYAAEVAPFVALWEAEKARIAAAAEEETSRPPTQDEMRAFFTNAIQQHMDAFAKTRNYDNILSACTYATSTVERFRVEGQYCVQARDATWAAGYALMEAVLSGERDIPTLQEVFACLPVLEWPA